MLFFEVPKTREGRALTGGVTNAHEESSQEYFPKPIYRCREFNPGPIAASAVAGITILKDEEAKKWDSEFSTT